MNYLLIGDDPLSKDIYIDKIKTQMFGCGFESFNFDSFYGQDIKDKFALQEAFLRLPQKSPKRAILIKNSEKCKKAIQDYLRAYLQAPFSHLVLILDANQENKDLEVFSGGRFGSLKVVRFRKKYNTSGFDLSRAIEQKKPEAAIKVLAYLLENGQKPYFVLGGIIGYFRKRYFQTPKKFSAMLDYILKADLDIKTGRLKPSYVLERLIVQLCLIERFV